MAIYIPDLIVGESELHSQKTEEAVLRIVSFFKVTGGEVPF